MAHGRHTFPEVSAPTLTRSRGRAPAYKTLGDVLCYPGCRPESLWLQVWQGEPSLVVWCGANYAASRAPAKPLLPPHQPSQPQRVWGAVSRSRWLTGLSIQENASVRKVLSTPEFQCKILPKSLSLEPLAEVGLSFGLWWLSSTFLPVGRWPWSCADPGRVPLRGWRM